MKEKIKLRLVYDDGEIAFTFQGRKVNIEKETHIWKILKDCFECSKFNLVVEYEYEKED